MSIEGPRLEDQVGSLELLDELRTRAKRVLTSGWMCLLERLAKDLRVPDLRAHSESDLHWLSLADEPDDQISPSLHLLALDLESQSHRLDSQTREIQQRTRDALLARVSDSYAASAKSRLRMRDSGTRQLTDQPVLEAARVLQALSTHGAYAISAASVHSLFVIIRELYLAHGPDWTIGSAASSRGGMPTAFTTWNCCDALLRLADVLEENAKALSTINEYLRKKHRLESSTLFAESPLADWRDLEIRRLSRAAIIELGLHERSLVVPLPKLIDALGVTPGNYSSAGTPGTPGPLSRPLSLSVAALYSSALREVSNRFNHTLYQISTECDDWLHTQDSRGKPDAYSVRLIGDSEKLDEVVDRHMVFAAARSALMFLESGARRLADLVKNFKEIPDLTDPAGEPPLAVFQRAEAEFQRMSNSVRRLMDPCLHALESDLDRELARASLEGGEPWREASLAFAALGLQRLGRPSGDPRPGRAAELILSRIRQHGAIQSSVDIDSDDRGFRIQIVAHEILRGVAALLGALDSALDAEIVDRMIATLEASAKRHAPGGAILGWRREPKRHPEKACRWTTALALLALDQLTRLLDARLDSMVRAHFSAVTSHTVTLSDLMWNDIGFYRARLAGDRDSEAENKSENEKRHPNSAEIGSANAWAESEEPLALTLQSLQAHCVGVSLGDSEPLSSLVLYGPPGTGKSTIVDALAGTCGIPLVKITPSDIVIGGEARAERRARDVFKALSYLSRAVVVFDEMEPVIESRELQERGPRTVFSFLTPGMLTKLRDLQQNARRGNMCYVLITNHIGRIDRAALRKGRFDRRVGVFGPDPLSRLGRLLDLCTPQARKSDDLEHRVVHVAVATSGCSMEMLGRQGYFASPRIGLSPSPKSILGYVQSLSDSMPALGDRENYVPDLVMGRGTLSRREAAQWVWHYLMNKSLADAVMVGLKEPYDLKSWSERYERIEESLGRILRNRSNWTAVENATERSEHQLFREDKREQGSGDVFIQIDESRLAEFVAQLVAAARK